MEVVGIIPVKKHSVRFPDKNFKKLAGRYLINIAAGRLSQVCDRVVISTDASYKVTEALTDMDIDMYAVLTGKSKIIIHQEPPGGLGGCPQVVGEIIKSGIVVDGDARIILSQVTSPVWRIEQLRDALDFFESHSLNSLVAVTPDFKPCGAFYLIRRGTFERYCDLQNPLYNPETYLYTIDYKYGVDIDYGYQLHIAEAIHRGNMVMRSP